MGSRERERENGVERERGRVRQTDRQPDTQRQRINGVETDGRVKGFFTWRHEVIFHFDQKAMNEVLNLKKKKKNDKS